MTEQAETPNVAHNLRDVLLEIRTKRGSLTPEIVVEEAADPNHPLHTRFEWNDTEAARKYRISQAASLLRVKYRQDVGDDRTDMRAFWVTRDQNGRSLQVYEPMEEVILDPMQRQLMLLQMRRDWQTFKKRYQHMQEFVAEVLADLDEDKTG